MSDNTESSRRRDRHRRHRGSGRSAEAGGQQRGGGQPRPAAQANQGGQNAGAGRRDGRNQGESRNRDERREKRQEPLPPLPKLPTPTCVKCGEPIQDITSALGDKDTGAPVHFDCVVKFLEGAENLGLNEKIVYVGQGRFAVMFFENPVDTRKFKIVRTIEWERRDDRAEWRNDISGSFSQVK
jgi:hypothetical protein